MPSHPSRQAARRSAAALPARVPRGAAETVQLLCRNPGGKLRGPPRPGPPPHPTPAQPAALGTPQAAGVSRGARNCATFLPESGRKVARPAPASPGKLPAPAGSPRQAPRPGHPRPPGKRRGFSRRSAELCNFSAGIREESCAARLSVPRQSSPPGPPQPPGHPSHPASSPPRQVPPGKLPGPPAPYGGVSRIVDTVAASTAARLNGRAWYSPRPHMASRSL